MNLDRGAAKKSTALRAAGEWHERRFRLVRLPGDPCCAEGVAEMFTTSVSLLDRLRQPGEQEAWERFVDLYTPLLFYWASRAGLSEPDAADLVQDVLLVLVQKLPEFSYDRQRSFRGWLRTVTRNKWRDQRRRLAGEANRDLVDLTQLPDHEDPEAFWETEYRQYLARRAMELMRAEFQPTTWKACWEVVVSGRPAGEVAAELGISIDSVYAAKSRVLRRLRQVLAGLLD
jgi:RNA polymerase sigma-70 factor (ECF subfamily)